MVEQREFDIVVFGATGVTGIFVVKEVAKTAINEPTLKWAVAGRSADKLKSILKAEGENLENIPVIVADVSDEQSLAEMCKRTKVVLNTVGPYRFYGEQVVNACVENGCHHLDVSGEPQFLEKMQLHYHEKAQKAGVYIVGACGFDSIPCDLGVEFVKQKFQGDLNSVESFICIRTGPAGYNVNLGTYESAIYGFAHANELKGLRTELNKNIFPQGIPRSKFPLKARGMVFKSEEVKGWCVPFPGSDKSVAGRTQRMNFDIHKERPVSVQTYMRLPSLLMSILTIIGAIFFGLIASVSFGRKLLKKYPSIFTFGIFKAGGPTKEQMSQATMKLVFLGEGWPERLSEPSDQHADPPSKKIRASVTGPDPGYLTTSTCLVQSGLTVLREADKMPLTGGVFTPASAFSKTSLIERLTKNGVVFAVQE